MEKISITRDLIEFLKEPNYNSINDLTIVDKLKILFKVFILTYVGLFIVSFPLAILELLGIIERFEMKTKRTYELINENSSDYKLYFLFLSIIIYPILEELIFRLSLTRFRINSLKISFALFSGMIVYMFIGKNLWIPKENYLFVLMTLFYLLILSLIVYILLDFNKNKLLKVEVFWNKKPKFVIYIIAFIFASLHIFNIEIGLEDFIYLPLVILPFFILALTLGYLRIRLGILFSILFHIIYNGLSFGLQELIKH